MMHLRVEPSKHLRGGEKVPFFRACGTRSDARAVSEAQPLERGSHALDRLLNVHVRRVEEEAGPQPQGQANDVVLKLPLVDLPFSLVRHGLHGHVDADLEVTSEVVCADRHSAARAESLHARDQDLPGAARGVRGV